MKFRKADIKRLERKLERMNEDERAMQKRYGKPWPGSMRAVEKLDAHALRRVLSVIGSAGNEKQGE